MYGGLTKKDSVDRLSKGERRSGAGLSTSRVGESPSFRPTHSIRTTACTQCSLIIMFGDFETYGEGRDQRLIGAARHCSRAQRTALALFHRTEQREVRAGVFRGSICDCYCHADWQSFLARSGLADHLGYAVG